MVDREAKRADGKGIGYDRWASICSHAFHAIDRRIIVRAELTDTQVQFENARTELATPFAKEAELAEKTARLKELNILLNMDEKDKSLSDDVPDGDAPEYHRSRGMER